MAMLYPPRRLHGARVNMADIVVQQLSKRYGTIAALRDCSLHVPDGQCTVIVGPSGCGKTTLLRVIAGLEIPDTGVIRIGQEQVNALPPHARDIAMVFQEFTLYPHMRVRDNLAFAAKLNGVDREEINRRINQTAGALGITHLLDRKPGQLSGGERQRAAVGRVFVRQPSCALYDEPMSNLDAAHRRQLRGDWKLVHRQFKTTSILVTHDQEDAMSLADQLVVMAAGAIQQVGPPLEVHDRPANRFVASFIGNPTMNFLSGRVTSNDGALIFHAEAGILIGLDERHSPHGGRELVLGIRPEAIAVSDEGPAINGRVVAVEPLGPFSNVRCEVAEGVHMTARLRSRHQVGDLLPLQLDLNQLHWFEPGDFGQRR